MEVCFTPATSQLANNEKIHGFWLQSWCLLPITNYKILRSLLTLGVDVWTDVQNSLQNWVSQYSGWHTAWKSYQVYLCAVPSLPIRAATWQRKGCMPPPLGELNHKRYFSMLSQSPSLLRPTASLGGDSLNHLHSLSLSSPAVQWAWLLFPAHVLSYGHPKILGTTPSITSYLLAQSITLCLCASWWAW